MCHRVIQELCTLIGIKDIYVKLEGSTRNYRAVIKGFFTILRQQVDFSHFLKHYCVCTVHVSILFILLDHAAGDR